MSAAIFLKDSIVHLRQLIGLFVAMLIGIGFVAILQYVSTEMGSPFNIKSLVVAQFVFFGMFALIASGMVLADEAQDGTAILLARLPVSKQRILLEKIAAGLASLTALFVLVAISHVVMGINGNYSNSPDAYGTVTGNFAIMLYSSYFVGIVVSLIFRRTIVIVMAGVLLQSTGWYLTSLYLNDAVLTRAGLTVLLLAAIVMVGPFIVLLPTRRLPMFYKGENAFLMLTSKSVSDTALITFGAVVLLLCTFIFEGAEANGADPLDLSILAIIILLAGSLATSAYVDGEADGIGGLLYHHPVPRHDILLSKVCAALLPLLLLAVAAQSASAHYAGFPLWSTCIFAGMVYVASLSAMLSFQSERLGILTGVGLFGGMFGWVFTWVQTDSKWLWFAGFPEGYGDMTAAEIVAVPFVFYLASLSAFTAWATTSCRFLASSTVTRSKIYGAVMLLGAVATIGATMAWRAIVGI